MTYYTRAQWGAAPPHSTTPWSNGLPNSMTLHHVGAAVGMKPDYLATVKSIQAHAFSKGLNDIDYNFLVDPHGNVYEGRGADVQSGAQHVGNATSLAVCYIEVDETSPLTAEAQDALIHVRDMYVKVPNAIIHPHRWWNNGGKFDTDCPGDALAAWADAPTGGDTDMPLNAQDIAAVAAAVDTQVGNRVIGAFQKNMKEEFIPSIVSQIVAKLPAGAVDADSLAKKVADELAKRLVA